jgi:serine/threonine protein kinase
VFRQWVITEQRDLQDTMKNEERVLEKFQRDGGHENIVTVLGYGWLDESKARFFVDLEACILNLDDFIKGNVKSVVNTSNYFNPLVEEKSLRCLSFWGIMKDISCGLSYMHSLHELHRDMKPRNGISHD